MKYRANASDTWHKIKIKALDGMPVGTIVDYDGQASDIPTGWEEVGNDYSTTEINTGKTWIDNKPIYRLVVNASSLSTSANDWHNLINVSNYNIDKLIDGTLLSTQASGGIWKPNLNIRNDYLACYSFIDLGSIDKIIIEYTKTTD